MAMAGLSPNLSRCSRCGKELDRMAESRVVVDIGGGGLVCRECCPTEGSRRLMLSKGTAKELMWLERGDLTRAARVRFSPRALEEGLRFLEAFVPYHLGKEPRSLRFLRQIRRPAGQSGSAL
jgi:DNA repair protein RecO (recombination protein O)